MDVTGQDPRIGVFVCNCGINIGGVVNVPKVRDYARTLENVVHVEDNLYTCSQDTQAKIRDAIKEHKLNRVIVASCSPRTHEPMFRETVRQAGLNKYLFEMANIRDQCSWVHMKQKGEATEKAEDLVRMAVANARLIQPLGESARPVVHKAIVVGGGIAGMTSALKIADQGYEVYPARKRRQAGRQPLESPLHPGRTGCPRAARKHHQPGQKSSDDSCPDECPRGGFERFQGQLHHRRKSRAER